MEYINDNKLNLRLYIALNRCQQTVLKKSQETLKKNNLTVSQFDVLEILYYMGDLKVGEIIERSLSTIGNISLVVDNLVKLSLVEKKKGEKDRRITYVSLTEEGRKRVEKVLPERLTEIDKIMEPLEAEDKRNLILLLQRLGLN